MTGFFYAWERAAARDILDVELESVAVQKKRIGTRVFRTKQAKQKSRQGEKTGGEQDSFLEERQKNFCRLCTELNVKGQALKRR